MLREFVRFADDTAGLDKTLRLFQGLCTAASGLATDAAPFVVARSQLNVGRRYFRLLKWHPCWMNAYSSLTGPHSNSFRMILEVMKWSILGMYFFLEAFTITNAMGATTFKWGPRMQEEANKCWFYSLVVSVFLSLFDLFIARPAVTAPADSVDKANVKKEQSTNEKTASRTNGTQKKPSQKPPVPPSKSANLKLYTQLVIDICDLFNPGSALGWIPAGPVVVGTTNSISSLLAGQQVWLRVQQKAKQS